MKACYVHVPFCQEICSYCDFTRCRYHAGLADKWLESLISEVLGKLQGEQLSTMYIGGGTPSALSYRQLDMLLDCLAPYLRTCEEYTMEANVESLDDEKLRICVNHGVNRISLGVQTLQDSLLEVIHRHHKQADICSAISKIHEHGIHNISIDLIYGLPGQSFAMWKQDLQEVVRFPIQHISLYALTIEEHSEFGRTGVKPADSQLEADMFEYAITWLEKHGFEHYEISNFAKQGYASKHNQMYWHYEDFCGIGCGASGKEHHQRYDNTKNLQTYLEHGASPDSILLSREDEMFETLMMSLRLKEGLYVPSFEERYHVNFAQHYAQPLKRQVEKGFLVWEEDYLKTSYQGMMMLNDVLVDFLPAP